MAGFKRWSSLRAELAERGLIDEAQLAAIGQRMRAQERAFRLAEIRAEYDVSQTTLAERIGVSQSRVSRIERGELDHTELATIRDYVEALGGEMEVVAKFGDERLIIA